MAVASRKLSGRSQVTSQPLVLSVHSMQYLAIIPTAWGNCGITWQSSIAHNSKEINNLPKDGLLGRILIPGLSEARIRALFPQAVEVLPDRSGKFRADTVPVWFGEMQAFLQDYYNSDIRSADAPDKPESLTLWPLWRPRLDLAQITPFQLSVLDAVAAIPRGRVLTYGQVAQQLNTPQAARAVGAALGKNPWPILVPCHRVIASTGKLTGFTAPGGVVTKRKMLEMEGYYSSLWRA